MLLGMICSKCNDQGHYNEVMGQGFYYCRTCKEEIPLEVKKSPGDITIDAGDDLVDAITYAITNNSLWAKQHPAPDPDDYPTAVDIDYLLKGIP